MKWFWKKIAKEPSDPPMAERLREISDVERKAFVAEHSSGLLAQVFSEAYSRAKRGMYDVEVVVDYDCDVISTVAKILEEDHGFCVDTFNISNGIRDKVTIRVSWRNRR